MKKILCSLLGILILFTVPAFAGTATMKPTRYLNISGVKVAAYESPGRKSPGVMLIHGNTSSAQSFQKILGSSFAKKHRVVAIDLPGYGKSENAATYSLGFLSSVIASAAQRLGVASGVLVGWSLGGDLVLQTAAALPQAKGFFVFGTVPVGYEPTLPPPFLSASESYAGQAVNYGVTANLTTAQIGEYVTAFFRPNYQNIPGFFFAAGQRTDPKTRDAVLLAATGQDPTFQDEVVIVRNLNRPLAIIYPNQDAFIRKEFLVGLAPSIPNLWKNKIVEVSSGHALQWERPDVFIHLLTSFIKDL